MTDTNKKFLQDEELSDFADQVLKGQMKTTTSDSNEELKNLEETILRLHNNMPSTSLADSTKKQMLVRLNARIRRERDQPEKKSFWASLFIGQPSRSQFITAIGVIALLIVAVGMSPVLGTDGSSTTVGTALTASRNILLPALLLGLIAIILWIKRKK
jgi:hypothetical protein